MVNVDQKEYSALDYHLALFENARKNAVLLIDRYGIIQLANRAFLLSFGYEREDIIGQNFSMLFTEDDREKDKPTRELKTVLEEGQAFDNNYLVNKNKVHTWVSGESLLLTGGHDKRIVKIIQNIHVQKESESSITSLNKFNEKILASIDDAVIVVNGDFQILKVNNAGRQLFQLPAQEPSNLDFRDALNMFEGCKGLEALITGVIQGEFARSTTKLDMGHDNAETKTFEVSCIKLEEGENAEALLLFHDITLQKRFEQQREDILNFVAHELSNPLTNVILNIQLMEELTDEYPSGELKDCLQRSKTNVLRLKKLISELYQSTKIATGDILLEKTTFEFDQIVEEAFHTLFQVFPLHNITKSGSASVKVFADKDKLVRVLINFLTNAIKYSDGKGPIKVETKEESNCVSVSVTDHGRGIPEKELPYVFNRFFRAERTKAMEGLGLGLFLSHSIIEAHKGQIWATSMEGNGSTFSFSLPL